MKEIIHLMNNFFHNIVYLFIYYLMILLIVRNKNIKIYNYIN